MGLHAQTPAGMRQTIGHGRGGVRVSLRPVHRLQEEALECQRLEPRRIDAGLRIDQLQLLAAGQRQRRVGLGADADPVDARRRRRGCRWSPPRSRSPGACSARSGARPAAAAARRRCRPPAGSPAARARRPRPRPPAPRRVANLPPPGAVGADEIGVAEAADGAGAILLAAAPQVAAGEAAEHRRPAGLAALALQGEEDLLDRSSSSASAPGGPPPTIRPSRCARSSQAGQAPQP